MILFWIGIGIIFLIVEILTITFYGFVLALASFAVAIYAAFSGDTNLDIVQGVIFVTVSVVASFFVPKFFKKATESQDVPQGLDRYIGQLHRVHLVDEDFKIRLDGVDYIIVSDDDLEDKDSVKIVDRRGSVFIGEKN